MDAFVSSYTNLSTGLISGFQKLGLLSIPLVLVITALINYFGGERAIARVGVAVFVVAVLALLLGNAVAFGNWVASFGNLH